MTDVAIKKEIIKKAEGFILGIIAQHGKDISQFTDMEKTLLQQDIEAFVAGVFNAVAVAKTEQSRNSTSNLEGASAKVICADCGSNMKLRTTTKYPNKDGSPRLFWGCSKYPECKGTHSAHQNSGKPMGNPANKETKDWRVKAHDVFDEFWQKYNYSRKESYNLLNTIMGTTHETGHIAKFNMDQCKLLIKKLKAYTPKE